MKAFKLINTAGGLCSFQEGIIPEVEHLPAAHFFVQHHIEKYELRPHPAPRYQFVVTLKGKLRFSVSDGSTFIIEPGIILVAKDLAGPGHTWELIEGDEWLRIYIVPPADAPDHFIETAQGK
ncbi:MAG: putative exported protein [Bacteroidetes bacterium]|nr:putative exported protein [Bacteroidota bacterium]